jgi:hypothetical protein
VRHNPISKRVFIFGASILIACEVASCSLKPSKVKLRSNGNAVGVVEPEEPVPVPTQVPAIDPSSTPSAPPVVEQLSLTSSRSTLKFKDLYLLEADISEALGLPKEELCSESVIVPGTTTATAVSCLQEAHRIALGGSEPYALGILTPIRESANSTPIALERIVLQACGQRVSLDLARASSGIFNNLAIDSDKALKSIDDASVVDAITKLINRAFLRPPLPDEILALKDFYRELFAIGTKDPAEVWARLTCYQVLTSTEFTMY